MNFSQFFTNQIDNIGIVWFVISQILLTPVIVFNIWQALEKHNRKNIIKLDLYAQICSIPTNIILSMNNLQAGMLNLILGCGLAIIRLTVTLIVYDWSRHKQMKLVIPVVGFLTATQVALFILNFYILDTTPWIFWVTQIQVLSGVAISIFILFNALLYKTARAFDKALVLQINLVNGNLVGVIRIAIDLLMYLYFLATFKWLLKPHQKYEMKTYITGDAASQNARAEVYKAAGLSLPENKNKFLLNGYKKITPLQIEHKKEKK